MALLDSKRGVAQAESIGKLTELGFVFVPLSCVAALFSMQIRELETPAPISAFFITAIATLTLTYTARLTIRSSSVLEYKEKFQSSIRQYNNLAPGDYVPTRSFSLYLFATIRIGLEYAYVQSFWPNNLARRWVKNPRIDSVLGESTAPANIPSAGLHGMNNDRSDDDGTIDGMRNNGVRNDSHPSSAPIRTSSTPSTPGQTSTRHLDGYLNGRDTRLKSDPGAKSWAPAWTNFRSVRQLFGWLDGLFRRPTERQSDIELNLGYTKGQGLSSTNSRAMEGNDTGVQDISTTHTGDHLCADMETNAGNEHRINIENNINTADRFAIKKRVVHQGNTNLGNATGSRDSVSIENLPHNTADDNTRP